ncbi:nitroreductase family protein [Anaerolentibacter hominis]|uniref:nitroreductase family protein n=1 Tax=Anaerolentibacter hominis TaxID=3079009 RepID=UPI0031B82C8C
MIEINKEKCVGCGQCVLVCPFTVLELNQDRKAENNGKRCLACMHCAAICPQDAITYDGENAETGAVAPLPENTAGMIKQFIYQRRSYRRFRKEPVPAKLIEKALDAAMIAPSAKNQHPTRWIVIESEEIKDKVMGLILNYCAEQGVSPEVIEECDNGNNPVMGDNAALLIGICKTDSLNPEQDTAIALATAELILQSEGVGTCWAGYLTRFLNQIPECKKILNIPDSYKAYGSMMIGYADGQRYRKIPARLIKAEITTF